jgi:hypothetical protein
VFAVLPLPTGRTAMATALHHGGLTRLLGQAGVDGVLDLLVDLADAATTEPLAYYSVIECNPVIVGRSGPRIADALLVES